MKTNIYLVSIVALCLGLKLTAQTSNAVKQKETAEQLTTNSTENKRTLSRVGGKTVPDNLSAESPVAVKEANISGESERNELLKLAEALAYQAKRLRNDANAKSGDEKNKLLSEANHFEKNCLSKQIKASEILGTICQVKFNSNKESISKLISAPAADAKTVSHARPFIISSEKNMQLAKNMRQESYLMDNPADRLVAMAKAEEKEIQALEEQSSAINLLWKK